MTPFGPFLKKQARMRNAKWEMDECLDEIGLANAGRPRHWHWQCQCLGQLGWLATWIDFCSLTCNLLQCPDWTVVGGVAQLKQSGQGGLAAAAASTEITWFPLFTIFRWSLKRIGPIQTATKTLEVSARFKSFCIAWSALSAVLLGTGKVLGLLQPSS